jgi:hypothetical protein
MMESKPHACGVDDIACSSTPNYHHAFGVDDGPPISVLFPVPFPEWVTSGERNWVTLG